MAKKTTTTTTKTDQVVVTAPVVSTIETSAPLTEKKAKKPKAPKVEAVTSTSTVTETVPETVVSASQSAESVTNVVTVSEVEAEVPIAEKSVEFLAKLQQIGSLISSLKAEYRTLEKQWTRELKVAQKQSSKRKRKAGNRAPSGFVKPTRISDELAKFLEKPSGSEMARTEVTRDINKYIRTHNLQDKENGRKINPDSKLATLLKLKKSDELTYFNLQRYMSPHFAKSVKETTAL